MTDLGRVTMQPCRVCAGRDGVRIEPRFGYAVCVQHADVPPTELNKAARQYISTGRTDWDAPKLRVVE